MCKTKRARVYLLHLDRPYRHARHYLGSSRDVPGRLADHAAGRGARLLQVTAAAGIGFVLARLWTGGREKERQLKRRRGSVRLCPICRGTGGPLECK